MDLDLQGRVVIVTGGASGIGAATVKHAVTHLARADGPAVVLTDVPLGHGP